MNLHSLFLLVATLLLGNWTISEAHAQFYNSICPGYASSGQWERWCEKQETQEMFGKLSKKLAEETRKNSKNLRKIFNSSSKAKNAGARRENWTSVSRSGKRIKAKVRANNRAIKKAKTIKSEFAPIKQNMTREEFFETVEANLERAESIRAGFESCDAAVESGTICECGALEVPASFEFRSEVYGINGSQCIGVAFVIWDSSLTINATFVTARYDFSTNSGLDSRSETASSPFSNSYGYGTDGQAIEVSDGKNWIAVGSGGKQSLAGNPIGDCSDVVANLRSLLSNATIEYSTCS